MIWDEEGLLIEELVAPPVSIKDRSLFGHAFSRWMYQSHAGIMGTGKPMYLFIPKGLNRY